MKKPLPHELPSGAAYTITDPVTRVLCTGTTLEGLISRISQVRGAMGAVCGLNLREEVERWLCEQYPQDCTEVDMSVPRKRSLNLSDIIHGSRVMASFIAHGAVPESREEAERRGAICQKCEFNKKFPLPCTGVCGELKDLAIRVSGNQGTYYDQFLHSCNICGCFLQAAIWIPLRDQCKGVTADMRKQFTQIPHCWKICGE